MRMVCATKHKRRHRVSDADLARGGVDIELGEELAVETMPHEHGGDEVLAIEPEVPVADLQCYQRVDEDGTRYTPRVGSCRTCGKLIVREWHRKRTGPSPLAALQEAVGMIDHPDRDRRNAILHGRATLIPLAAEHLGIPHLDSGTMEEIDAAVPALARILGIPGFETGIEPAAAPRPAMDEDITTTAAPETGRHPDEENTDGNESSYLGSRA